MLAIWEVSWKQWQYRNFILHDEQHPWKQGEIIELDQQIQLYKTRYNQTSYLPRDRSLFDLSLVKLHQYPTPIKHQWMLSVQRTQLRKIPSNVTSISQERQLLSNWLTSRSPSTQGRGQLTLRVSAQEVWTTQGVHANPSITPATRGVANNNETTSIIEVAANIIRIGHSQAHFTDK